jgi:hypothetical protein
LADLRDRPDEVRWARAADLAVVDSGDRVAVLDLSEVEAAVPLVMEGPAAAVWRALDRPRTTTEVCVRVAADFGLPATEVRADVDSFLSLLGAKGLVRIEHLPRSDPHVGGRHDS